MTLKEDLKACQSRWAEVDAVIAEEKRTASLELRWQELNAAWAMAVSLGLRQEDSSDAGVRELWAKLKEKAASRLPTG